MTIPTPKRKLEPAGWLVLWCDDSYLAYRSTKREADEMANQYGEQLCRVVKIYRERIGKGGK